MTPKEAAMHKFLTRIGRAALGGVAVFLTLCLAAVGVYNFVPDATARDIDRMYSALVGGYLRVGDGSATPGTSLEGSEGIFVEGHLEVDGAIDTAGAMSVATTLNFSTNGDSFNNITDATFDATRNNTGAVTYTCSDDNAVAACVYDAGGAADVQLGSADATAAIIIADADTQIRNGATGNVDLGLHDYADTADDDMAHVLLRGNCTTATVGAEDCDGTLYVTEGGANVIAFAADGDGGITVGHAANDSFTVTTDGTGTGEVVLPLESIGAGEIVNIVRSVNLPLGAFIECASMLPFDGTAADTEPDFAGINSNVTIEYDVTGGSIDTTGACTTLMIPPDYVSGNSFKVVMTQAGATGANVEDIGIDVSVNGAALTGEVTVAATNQTAVQTVTVAVGTYAAGDSVGLILRQADAAADDAVNVYSVELQYTATQ